MLLGIRPRTLRESFPAICFALWLLSSAALRTLCRRSHEMDICEPKYTLQFYWSDNLKLRS